MSRFALPYPLCFASRPSVSANSSAASAPYRNDVTTQNGVRPNSMGGVEVQKAVPDCACSTNDVYGVTYRNCHEICGFALRPLASHVMKPKNGSKLKAAMVR